MRKLDELKRLCDPIVEYLKKNCNPYHIVVISGTHIKFVEYVASIPVNEQDDQLNN